MGTGASRESDEAESNVPKSGRRRDAGARVGTSIKDGRQPAAKKRAQVGLTRLGFSPSELNIHEGEEVSFHWSGVKGPGHNVRQVISDDGKHLAVNGGFSSGERSSNGNFLVQFNLEGTYSFVSEGYSDQQANVFTVTVRSKSLQKVEIKENGFSKPKLCIREGTSVRWHWASPCTLVEVKLCSKHCAWIRTDVGNTIPTQAGWYKHDFKEPGLHYFLAEPEGEGQTHLCVVEVKETQCHHRIDVTDKRFIPALLTIQQGDRVWWNWDRFKCQKKHKIIEVEMPTGHNVTSTFPTALRGGFTSSAPSRTGALSHVFEKPGVYYYCDNNYDDVREYVGVIVVKPKPKEHHIEVTEEGFYPDLCVASVGDRIRWNWDPSLIESSLSITQVESCVTSSKNNLSDECNNRCKYLSDDHGLQITKLGVATTSFTAMGVYHYRVSDTPMSVGCCSVIINAAVRDHTIRITKTGYEPHLLSVHPGDTVWWTWDGLKTPHNIIQVSQQGEPITSGFCSGPPVDSPGAFHTTFDKEGVVYYHSAGLPNLYGAIMTVPQPQVHQVIASKNALTPDPVTVRSGDCVAWVWPLLRKHKLIGVSSTQEVFELQKYTQDSVSPRRCCALQFTNPGVFHYYSKAFSNKGEKFMYEHSSRAVLSSVVVSMPKDQVVVRVNSRGFHPQTVNIKKGMSVVWSWKEVSSQEHHNIIMVTAPNANDTTSQAPSPVAEADGGFTSGPMQSLGSYSHTWEKAGTFHVRSRGVKNGLGCVRVWDSDSCVHTPVPKSADRSGGVVQKGHQIDLTVDQADATIYYTLDGSIPELNASVTRVLKADQGIVLKRSGLHIVRAIAHSDQALPSDIYTSGRYWVLEGNDGNNSESDDDAASIATEDFEEQQLQESQGPTNLWQWLQCVPVLKGWQLNSHSVELYWDLPDASYRHLVESYHIYINGICYHNNLVPPCQSVVISGFMGGASYTISVVAMPTMSSVLPQESTKLKFVCPAVSDHGGPVLSSEISEVKCQLPVRWKPLAAPGLKYQVYVSGRQYGEEIIPKKGEKESRVMIQDYSSEELLKIHVLALPRQTDQEAEDQSVLISNDLDISLPLNTDSIIVPNSRKLEGLPYLQILEGSLKPPGDDVVLLPEVEPETANEVTKDEDDAHTQESFQTTEAVATTSSLTQAKVEIDVTSEGLKTSEETCSQPESSHTNLDAGNELTDREENPEVEYDHVPPLALPSTACDATSSASSSMPHSNLHDASAAADTATAATDAASVPAVVVSAPTDAATSPAIATAVITDDASAVSDGDRIHDASGVEMDGIGVHKIPPPPVYQDDLDLEPVPVESSASGIVAAATNEDAEGLQVGTDIPEVDLYPAPSTTDLRELLEASEQQEKFNDPHPNGDVSEATSSQTDCKDKDLTDADIHENEEESERERDETENEVLKQDVGSLEDATDSNNVARDNDVKERMKDSLPGESVTEENLPSESLPKENFPKEISKEYLPKENKTQDQVFQIANDNSNQEADVGSNIDSKHRNESKVGEDIPADVDVPSPIVESDGNDPEKALLFQVSNETTMSCNRMMSYQTSLEPTPDGEEDASGELPLGVEVMQDGKVTENDGGKNERRSSEVAMLNQISNETTLSESNIYREVELKDDAEMADRGQVGEDNNADDDALSSKDIINDPNPRLQFRQGDTDADAELACHNDSAHPSDPTQQLTSPPSPIALHDDNHNDVDGLPSYVPAQALDESVDARTSDEKSQDTEQTMEFLVPRLKSVVSSADAPELHVSWCIPSEDASLLSPHHYLVCVEGEQFIEQDINSHSRHELQSDDDSLKMRHQWNAGRGLLRIINKGLCESTRYKVSVIAIYKPQNSKKKTIKMTSQTTWVTTGGRPMPPKLSLTSVGVQEVTLTWEPGLCHEDIEVIGYALLKNNRPTTETIPYGITEKTIRDLKPGSKCTLSLSTITANRGPHHPSNSLTVICPRIPDPPVIDVKQSSSLHSATITWPKQKAKYLCGYKVYVNGKEQAELALSDMERLTQCEYILDDLIEDETYNVYIKACSGLKPLPLERSSSKAVCQTRSGRSNQLSIRAKTPPSSPSLRLEGMHPGGIDVMWEGHEQDEGVNLTGYVIIKDGVQYGSVLGVDCTRSTVGRLKPGVTVELQIMAISDDILEPGGDDLLKKYPTCEPGPALRVQYTGLLAPPSKVWTELVTGHSMLIVWHRGKKPNKNHYTDPDAFMVRWWKTSGDSNMYTMETQDDNFHIEDLESGSTYSIMIEARKWSTYEDEDDEDMLSEDERRQTYLVTASSKPITAQTARPPDPPSDLKVTSTGPSVLELRWTSAVEHGSEILGLKMYVTLTEEKEDTETVKCLDLLPDATEVTVTDLEQGKDYVIHILTITDDFFDQLPSSHPFRKARDLPKSWADVEKEVESPWLPYVAVGARTHGNTPPMGLNCTDTGDGWMGVGWRPPSWGGFYVESYTVEWEDVSGDDGAPEGSEEGFVEVGPKRAHAKLHGLTPGRTYEIQVKAYMKPDPSSKSKSKIKSKQGKMNMVLESDPISVRLPCHIAPPQLRIAGYSSYHLDLRWSKPQLLLQPQNQDPDCQSATHPVKLTLLGYRLMVEGSAPIYLSSDTTRYTLTQIKGGRTIKVHLVAVTTPKHVTMRSLRKKENGKGDASTEKKIASILKSIGDDKDETASSTLFVTVPKSQSGNIVSCTCTYKHVRRAQNNYTSDVDDEGDDPLGFINLQWSLLDCGSAEEQGILGYDVSWMCDADGKEHVANVSKFFTSHEIPVYNLGCMYDISVQPVKDEDIWQDLNSPSLQCEIPGPPAPPTLCCVSMTTSEFILEWSEPRTFGDVGVRGYQVYMNGRQIGQALSASHFKAAVPCRPNRIYILGICALSDDPNYSDSAHDQNLRLCTPESDSAPEPTKGVSLLESLSAPDHGHTHQGRASRRGRTRKPSSSRVVPEDIELKLSSLTSHTIGISWDFLRSESVSRVQRLQVGWSSVAKPKEIEALLSPTATNFTIKNCVPGTNHFITITGLDKDDHKVCRSKQLIVQTSSQITTPQPFISSTSFKAITLKWDKPNSFGGANVSGYRVRVNGHQTAILPPSASMYSYKQGKMCHAYSFSLQATCSNPQLHSTFSDPIQVTWPGVNVPDLLRLPSSKVNSIVVGWSEPEVLGGAKIRNLKVLVMMDQPSHYKHDHYHHHPLKTSSALAPDTTSTEFLDLLPHVTYTIYLDVYLEGLTKPVRSKALVAQVARRPLAPRLRIDVVGAEERRQLDEDACSMMEDRDKLLQELFSLEHDLEDNFLVDVQYQDDLLTRVSEVSSFLAEIETSLDNCLERMKLYTGTVRIALNWDIVQDDGDAVVSGYKVLVNGEQYGFILHSQVTETEIKLSAYNGKHRLNLMAMTDHPVGHSDLSEVVTVDTSPYRPFVAYCLNSVHKKQVRYPNEGCCSFQETLHLETHPDFCHLPSMHQHLPTRRVPAPSVTVYDQTQGTYRLLVSSKLSNKKPIVILFWTHWCLASQAIMSHFMSYAKRRSKKLVCVGMCCESGEDTDTHRETMNRLMTDRGWKGEGAVQHCCCCSEVEADGSKMVANRSLNTGHSLVQFATEKKSSDALSAVSDHVPELFGVMAVPTVIVIHPEGYLGWKSCFAVTDRSAFTSALDTGIINMLRTNPANFTNFTISEAATFSDVSQDSPRASTPGRIPKKQGSTAWNGNKEGAPRPLSGSASETRFGVGASKPLTPTIVSPQLRHFVLKKKKSDQDQKNLISIDTRPYSAKQSQPRPKGEGKVRPNSSVTV